MTGVLVEPEQWDLSQLPPHLRMTFRVIDDKGKKLQESENLDELKFALKDEVQNTLSNIADDGIEQSGVHIWNFAELPQFYEQKKPISA